MTHAENMHQEFKRTYTSNLKKEIVAFANTEGGTIYIGVEDDGSIIGLADPDNTMLQITSMIRDAIRPDVSIFIQCQIITEANKQIITVEVQRGTARPYYIHEKGLKPSGVYVRLGSASVPASEQAIRQMIIETDGNTFENIRSSSQDLTFTFTESEFISRSLELGDIQKKNLGLLNEDDLFTNLGLLLSDQNNHTIKTAVFQGTDKSVFRDRKEFTGSVLQQLNDVFQYIDFYNKTKAEFDGLIRNDIRDYPVVAIREALLNAIIHRDYSFSGSTLISIYENRIEILSLGSLVPGLSLEAIKIGASQSRNEKLADIFYRLKLIEAYGTGIAKIMESYKDYAVEPEIIATEGAFLTVLPNVNEPPVRNAYVPQNKTPLLINEALPGYHSFTLKEQKIIGYVQEHGNITRKEVEQLLNIKQTAAGRLLRSLFEAGVLKKDGNGRNTTYFL